MQKKKSTKYKNHKADICAIFLCLFGSALSLFLFWKDLNSSLSKLSESPIGTVSYKYKAVQRHFKERLIWDRLQRDSLMYNGDVIRTAELSDVIITFENGDAIELSENTLIQIFTDQNGIKLELFGGNIIAKVKEGNDSAITISAGQNQVKVTEGGMITLSSDPDTQGLNLQVLEGSASFRTSEGIQQAKAGMAFSIDGSGRVETKPQVAMISPRPNQGILSSQENQPVRFSWNPLNFTGDESVRLEVSEDRNFTRIIQSLDVSDKTEISLDLPKGNYWWRVYPVPAGEENPNQTEADVAKYKLSILPADLPESINPKEGSTYQYQEKIPPVEFSWTSPQGSQSASPETVSSYLLEVADNPDMQNPQVSLPVEGTFVTSSEIGEGTWYWRVKPVYSENYTGEAGSSPIASFKIEQEEDLPPLSLVAPGLGVIINIAPEERDSLIYFSWKNAAEASDYTIQIGKDREFKNPSIAKKVQEHYYSYRTDENILQEGAYFWRVFYTGPSGKSSPPSEVRSFIALRGAVKHEAVFPPHDYTVEERASKNLAFTWRNNLPFTSNFQISTDADFTQLLVDEPVTSSSYTGQTLLVGTYYWRITTTITGKEVSEGTVLQTPPRRLVVVPPLLSPELESPLGRVNPQESLVFRWLSVPDAEGYRFTLYRGDGSQETRDQKPVYENPNTQTNTFSLSMDALEEGPYFWTLQAIRPENPQSSRRESLPATGEFWLGKLRFVLLESPPSGQVINGLDAYRNPVNLRWSSEEPVAKSRFILSQNRNPLEGRPVMDISNPDKVIKLTRLGAGTYYWTIQAESSKGIDISASVPASFQILPIKIALVSLDAPKGGQTFKGSDTLRNPITVRWSSTEQVGKSRFVLSRNSNPLRGQSLMDLTNPSRSITLPKLTEGTYYWTIQAETPDGLNISAAAPFSFQILPVSLKPVSLDAPRGGQTFTSQEVLRTPITVRWSSTEQVGKSRFVLSRNPNPLQGQPLMDLTNPSRSITLPKLTEGTYYWTIQAETPNGLNISATAPLSFQILPVPVSLKPVSLDAPRGGQTFTSQEVLRTPITVRWSSTESVGKSRFVLSRNPNPLQGQPLMDLTNPSRSITLPKLTEGTYYWTIQAETPNGLNISAAVPLSFQILPSQTLPNQTLPSQALPNQTLPSQALPNQTLPSQTLPNQTLPSQTLPNQTLPSQALPNQTLPSQALPNQTLPRPLLPAAQGLRPKQGDHITADYLQEKRDIIFEWNSVPGANAYRFTLLKSGSRERPLIQTDPMRQTRYILDDLSNLDVGDFIWLVEALSLAKDGSIEQRGIMAEYRFAVDIPIPSTPVLRDPGILYGN